jgi:hypothetical protein
MIGRRSVILVVHGTSCAWQKTWVRGRGLLLSRCSFDDIDLFGERASSKETCSLNYRLAE